MLYVFRRRASNGALALASALAERGTPARKVSRVRRRVPDAVVCWGDQYPAPVARALNNIPVVGKYRELLALKEAGVATVEASLTPHEDYLKRSFDHHGGNDLLNGYNGPGYWVKREEIVKEFRVHVFAGVSIRAGRKTPFRDDAHEWIRSHDAGWSITYDGTGVKQKHRDIARAAVEALGLDFAAVDVAQHADGSVFVLEVNRAPGLEGRTIEVYAQKIADWMSNAE